MYEIGIHVRRIPCLVPSPSHPGFYLTAMRKKRGGSFLLHGCEIKLGWEGLGMRL